MTELIKQRLVGMLIVVIAGVVFLPDLLDGKKQLTKEEFKKVPARPDSEEQPILTEFPREEVIEVFKQAPQLASVTADDQDPSDSGDNETKMDAEPAATEETQVAAQVAEKTNDAELTNTAKSPEFDSQAWILQLGSFKHKENVDALRQKLSEAGFDTFTKPVKTKAGLLSKVYIGPELDKGTLQAAQGKLKELVGIEGKITRFNPIK